MAASVAAPVAAALITTGGSMIAGAAQGWMRGKQLEEEERRIKEEQKRRTDSYRGLGESTSFRRQAQERPTSRQITTPGLGQRRDVVGRRESQVGQVNMGQDYQKIAQQRAMGLPRYEYDPETGRIVRN